MIAAFARRRDPVAAQATDAESLAAACRDMAARFRSGGRLLAAGRGPSAADVAHVVVEFVHPVIVGTRALPALALPDGGSAGSVAVFGEPGDVLLVFAPDGPDPDLAGALEQGAADGLLTIALTGPARARADHVLVVGSDDPWIVREGHVTTYHVLWELVHVYLAGGAP